MAAGIALTQRQNVGMVPEHLLGKSVLKMSAVELQEFVRAQMAENPALALSEDRPCPVCGWELVGDACIQCGYRAAAESEVSDTYAYDWHEDGWKPAGDTDDELMDTFALVAAPKSLADHLKEQVRSEFAEEMVSPAETIIDALDDDGYLREPLIDLASRHGMSVPEFEAVLQTVQGLDPAGIAARSLQECLLIQLRRLNSTPLGEEVRMLNQVQDDIAPTRHAELDSASGRVLAETIVRDHWDGVERMRLDKIAQKLGVDREDVEDALLFIRERLNPRPAAMFRDPWERLAPRQVSRTAPDIVVRRTETGLVAEVMDPVTGRVTLDEVYAGLYSEMTRSKNAFRESDRAHVRDCMRDAKCLIDAIEFRGSTLARIAQELIVSQSEFFTEGASALKPLTKKELAQRIGVHESTVCRATQDKTIRLPSGEVISIEVLFDSALPVKELVRQLATQQLSDGQIAEKLSDAGISIARRTVAKYREQLRLPSVDLRLAA